MFEDIINPQMFAFIKLNTFLASQCPPHLTESRLLHYAYQCVVNMDNCLINSFLFLNLKKAFDTAYHEF